MTTSENDLKLTTQETLGPPDLQKQGKCKLGQKSLFINSMIQLDKEETIVKIIFYVTL